MTDRISKAFSEYLAEGFLVSFRVDSLIVFAELY